MMGMPMIADALFYIAGMMALAALYWATIGAHPLIALAVGLCVFMAYRKDGAV